MSRIVFGVESLFCMTRSPILTRFSEMADGLADFWAAAAALPTDRPAPR